MTPRSRSPKSSRGSRSLTDTLPVRQAGGARSSPGSTIRIKRRGPSSSRRSASSRRGGSSGNFYGPYGTLDFEPQDGIFEKSRRGASSRRGGSSRRSVGPYGTPRVVVPQWMEEASKRSAVKSVRSASQPSWLGEMRTPAKSGRSSARASGSSKRKVDSAYLKRKQREQDIDPVRKTLDFSSSGRSKSKQSKTKQSKSKQSTKRRSLVARLSRVPSRKPKSSRATPKRSVKKARAGVRNQRVKAAELPPTFAKGDKLSRTPRSSARPKTSRKDRGRCKEKRCEMILQNGNRCKLCVKDGRAKYCHIHRA